jgi:hypothetical protein
LPYPDPNVQLANGPDTFTKAGRRPELCCFRG